MTAHAMTFGFPALLNKSGGCGTRFAQTVLAENSWFVSVAQHGNRGFKVKTRGDCHSVLDTESSDVQNKGCWISI